MYCVRVYSSKNQINLKESRKFWNIKHMNKIISKLETLWVAYCYYLKKCLIAKKNQSWRFFRKIFWILEKIKKTGRAINIINMYSKFHYDRKNEKHLKLRVKNYTVKNLVQKYHKIQDFTKKISNIAKKINMSPKKSCNKCVKQV